MVGYQNLGRKKMLAVFTEEPSIDVHTYGRGNS